MLSAVVRRQRRTEVGVVALDQLDGLLPDAWDCVTQNAQTIRHRSPRSECVELFAIQSRVHWETILLQNQPSGVKQYGILPDDQHLSGI